MQENDGLVGVQDLTTVNKPRRLWMVGFEGNCEWCWEMELRISTLISRDTDVEAGIVEGPAPPRQRLA
jgi:hypothetical protein